jgi:transcriptional regulator with XRE-family HTH domain
MDDHAGRDAEYRAALERLLPYERIARLVIGLRMELGVSQEELARRVGTSPSAIARLESGSHRPSVETLRRVATALDRELVIGFRDARSQGVPGRNKAASTSVERHLTRV